MRDNDPLASYWMPFTANRAYKAAPRHLVGAEGLYYHSADGRKLLDGTAGLWCVNAGHCRAPIVAAIQAQAARLDFSPPYQLGHPQAFELANRLADLMPIGLERIFFTNSGSEAVDSALKIALAVQRVRGKAGCVRLVGRERGFHGAGFGGMSVGGIGANRRDFGTGLTGVDHLSSTHVPEHNKFSKGLPAWGAHLADDLQRLVALHGAGTIAAVIVEPMAGSAGVLVPPLGYLERLRMLCNQHNILLIFDEVITAFGRVGGATAAETWGVTPDIIVLAKGLTNGAVPMGAVAVDRKIHEDIIANAPEGAIELFHGYTYSGHPLACAAGIATLDIYRAENLFDKATALGDYWEQAAHSLRTAPHVIDIRTIGLTAGIELAPRRFGTGSRTMEIFHAAFDSGLLVRVTGDTIALSPPLILDTSHIDEIFGRLADLLKHAI